MTVTMHTCRGNFKSAWVAEGGYESVAEAMFAVDVDAFFMEFDSDRSGTFEPLRLLPASKTVVLGLVTTKVGVLEDRDGLGASHRRGGPTCRSSAQPSPQCGFSSTHHGIPSDDEQWRKLSSSSQPRAGLGRLTRESVAPLARPPTGSCARAW